jgi:hypothetical protein
MMYVAWAVVLPEAIKELELPFEKEFELAKKIK